jgi:hypothetical protein
MKIPSIKKIVEERTIEQLHEMQYCLENEITLQHTVEGEDEGEQLTHVLAAIWIKTEMKANNSDFKTELRNYTTMVRNTIS